MGIRPIALQAEDNRLGSRSDGVTRISGSSRNKGYFSLVHLLIPLKKPVKWKLRCIDIDKVYVGCGPRKQKFDISMPLCGPRAKII